MPAAAPDKTERRVVGQDPIRLDRLGRLEQPDGARGFGRSPHPNPPPLAGEGVRFAGRNLLTLPSLRSLGVRVRTSIGWCIADAPGEACRVSGGRVGAVAVSLSALKGGEGGTHAAGVGG